MPSLSQRGPTHIGLDVHKDTISAGILPPGQDAPEVERIWHDEESVRRLVARFPDPRDPASAMRPGRQVTSWPGWSAAWVSPAT